MFRVCPPLLVKALGRGVQDFALVALACAGSDVVRVEV